jgi:hypothetical protein
MCTFDVSFEVTITRGYLIFGACIAIPNPCTEYWYGANRGHRSQCREKGCNGVTAIDDPKSYWEYAVLPCLKDINMKP